MISINFTGNIHFFNTKGEYTTKENVEDAEIPFRLNELVNKYVPLLIASEGAMWSVSYVARTTLPSNLSSLLNNIMVETDGRTYLNVIDDGVTGPYFMQTLSMMEENVRVTIMNCLTSAYLRRKVYDKVLEKEGGSI